MPRGIYPRTKEQYEKIGIANAIKLKGRKLSMETRKRMSLAKRKRIEELGYMNSPETRKKLSEIMKRKWANRDVTEKQVNNIKKYGVKTQFKKGHKVTKKTREAVKKSRAKQIFPIKNSSIEVKIQNFLTKLHIEFVTHKYMNLKSSYQCDIFIPIQKGINQKTIIETDGCYWHGCATCKFKQSNNIKNAMKKDKLRTKELIEKGFKVIRIWEHDIKNMNLNDFKLEVRNFGSL